MSERYKTISFNNFSDMEQCNIIAPTKKSFECSNNLIIENNKIKLGKKMKGGALFDSTLNSYDFKKKLSFMYGSLYFLATDGSDCFIKKCNPNNGAFTTVITLPDSGNSVFCLIKFRGLAIASYENNANDAYLCKHSVDGMTMTTPWSDTNLIALVGASVSINDYKIVHDRLYILCSDSRIYYSDDGITFVLIVVFDSNFTFDSLEYLSGYLYVSNNTDSFSNGLIRISLAGEIQDETVSLVDIDFFQHRVFAGHSYVIINRKYLYRIEGSSLIPIFSFSDYTYFIFSDNIVEALYFWHSTDKDVLLMNIDEKFSRPYEMHADILEVCSFHDAGYLKVGVQSSLAKTKVAIYDNLYAPSGNIKTFIARLKGGLGTPVQLVLNHKSLTANAWIKVYLKFDNASTWGDAVITSTTLNAVRKIYDIPPGAEYSFVQAKIEYGTDDDSETPEDATLDLIYLPTGLVNSQ